MKIIVVGNNVAGTNVAKAVRDADQDAVVDVFTDENMAYYARPKLIDFLAGEAKEEELLFYPMDWYEKNRITLTLGAKVEKVDPAKKTVTVAGREHPYDKLVLANGSSSYVPPLKGLPKENIFTLRNVEDARMIRKAASGSKHAIIIGGGLLGLEAARALATGFPHMKVTVLEYAEHLLMRQLDHEGAAMLQKWVEALGTKVLTQAQTEEVLGDSIVSGVRLKDGRVIEGDLVLISAGARGNLGLAKDAGLAVNRGVVVDSSLRTSDPDIFAVGDVAEFDGKTWGIIPPALEQAKIAGKVIAGQDAPPYKGTVPSNTLKVMGFDLMSIGTVRSEHEPPETGFEEIRSVSQDGKVYRKFVFKGDEMIGAIIMGTKKDVPKVTRIIKEKKPAGELKPRLSDPEFAIP